ncbi:Histone deacetylase hda1 [Lecanora helva]
MLKIVGNGIQQAFYQDPSVLYISLHVHEGGEFYPQGPYGNHIHCGNGLGEGKNINIPWPTKGMGDADYLLAFQHIVMPAAYDFDPDLVIIAAGFDAADGDQLGGCFVTPPCYAQMTHMLMGLARGKLVVCLEGGYNLTSISKSALAVTRTLIGEKPERLSETKATEAGIDTVQMVAMHQSKYWPSLYPKDVSKDVFAKSGACRMHDVIRYYQANQLKEAHNMTNLVIYRDKLSKVFDGQVMATPNFEGFAPLLVVIHDPPEMMGTPDPVSKRLELHNTWLLLTADPRKADDLKHYVDWAAAQGFGVIDVNVPKYLTGLGAAEGTPEGEQVQRMPAANELAIYLWENYIEYYTPAICNDASHVFFIGVGSAYETIVNLLETRCVQGLEQDFLNRVSGLINFVSENLLKPVANQPVISSLPKWYKNNSLVFVANDHLVWEMEPQKKRSKRYGNLVKSPTKGLNDMLIHHQADVHRWIMSRINGQGGEILGRSDP